MLDVNMVHHLTHESVVCCVRFSHDGKYVATGSNRSAQIFEVASGSQVSQLIDETVDKDGDLYIRSVCFSPDGRYLATGAEDKLIRVSTRWLDYRQIIRLRNFSRSGISPLAELNTLLLVMNKTSTPSTLRRTVVILHLAVATKQYDFGI